MDDRLDLLDLADLAAQLHLVEMAAAAVHDQTYHDARHMGLKVALVTVQTNTAALMNRDAVITL